MTTKYIAELTSPEEALELPEGRLAMNMGFWIQVSVSAKNVLECAKLIIEHGDNKELTSQAEVVVRGGKLGWGVSVAASSKYRLGSKSNILLINVM